MNDDHPLQAGPNNGVVPLPEEDPGESISLSSSLASTSHNPSSGDLSLSLDILQQGVIASDAVSPITNAAQGQRGQLQVHQDNNLVHLPAKRNSPDDVSGESHVGESSNMGEQAALAKRLATESEDSTHNNIVNPSASVPVTQQLQQFFTETPRSEPIRDDGDGTFVLPQRFQPSEPGQVLSRYMDTNDRIRNARQIMFQRQSEQAGPSSSRFSRGSPGINYSGEASSSITENYHNQVQLSAAGTPHFFSYEPSFPLPQITSAEARTRPPHEAQNVLDTILRGRPLTFEELMLVDYSLVLDAYEIGSPEQFDAPNNGLSVETIMQHMESETFTSVDKEGPQEIEKCPICLDEFENEDKLGRLYWCAHKFHAHCIIQWLVENNVCPICKRTALNIDDVKNDAGAGAPEVNNEGGEDDSA